MREHFWKLKSPKFAPRLRETAIWKSKSLRTEGAGTLLEVEVAKICTTPARERFGSQKRLNTRVSDHFLRFKVLFAWQAQRFRHSIVVKIAKIYCNSEVKRLLNMSYFREVSQNSFSYSQLVSQSVSQSDSQLISQLVSQSISRSPVSLLVSQSVGQSATQFVSQSVSQSVSQLVSQSVSQLVH